MLTEEKCKKALKSLTFAVIRNYSNTKFDFVSRKQILKSGYQRQHDMIEQLIKEHFEPQPYEWEDLKEGMWVWDKKEKLCNLIYETRINCAGEQEIEFQFRMPSLDGNEFMNTIFEENRFFPVQMANVRCE